MESQYKSTVEKLSKDTAVSKTTEQRKWDSKVKRRNVREKKHGSKCHYNNTKVLAKFKTWNPMKILSEQTGESLRWATGWHWRGFWKDSCSLNPELKDPGRQEFLSPTEQQRYVLHLYHFFSWSHCIKLLSATYIFCATSPSFAFDQTCKPHVTRCRKLLPLSSTNSIHVTAAWVRFCCFCQGEKQQHFGEKLWTTSVRIMAYNYYTRPYVGDSWARSFSCENRGSWFVHETEEPF